MCQASVHLPGWVTEVGKQGHAGAEGWYSLKALRMDQHLYKEAGVHGYSSGQVVLDGTGHRSM